MSFLDQVRRGLWLAAKWVLLPLLVLFLVGVVGDELQQRRERERFRELQEKERTNTCTGTPSACDDAAARLVGLPPGRLPAAAAFGPYRFTYGNGSEGAFLLRYEGGGGQLLLSVQRQAANAVGSTVSPGGRRYAESIRKDKVARLVWADAGYRFSILLLPPAAPGSEAHAAAVALLDAVPAG